MRLFVKNIVPYKKMFCVLKSGGNYFYASSWNEAYRLDVLNDLKYASELAYLDCRNTSFSIHEDVSLLLNKITNLPFMVTEILIYYISDDYENVRHCCKIETNDELFNFYKQFKDTIVDPNFHNSIALKV